MTRAVCVMLAVAVCVIFTARLAKKIGPYLRAISR